jgi:hypothetical protein
MRRAVRFLFCVFVLAGCASIVGIEDHVFQSAASTQCQEYCDTVLKNCTGPYAVYTGKPTCLGVCSKLPPGDPLEPLDGNSVACRKKQADQAATEPQFFCPRASPGGGGPGVGGTCGTNCESYCMLLQASCPDNLLAVADCVKSCSGLHDVGSFDVDANHHGDTLQCRLVHVSSATVSADAAKEHCPHTNIHPAAPWCLEDQTAAPDCAEFCRLNAAACSGDNAAYESNAQCMAVCAALPPGTYGDRDQNTAGCRLWHCYNSLLNPMGHCSHTGPGGDAHCGADMLPDDTGNCHAYCILLEKACGTDFMTKYGGMQTNCQKDCAALPGAKRDSGYNLTAAKTGNTVQCRLLHVSRALDPAAAAAECPSALGNAGSECQ